jgi:hypothetical protein
MRARFRHVSVGTALIRSHQLLAHSHWQSSAPLLVCLSLPARESGVSLALCRDSVVNMYRLGFRIYYNESRMRARFRHASAGIALPRSHQPLARSLFLSLSAGERKRMAPASCSVIAGHWVKTQLPNR